MGTLRVAREKGKKRHVKLIVFLSVVALFIGSLVVYNLFFMDKTVHITAVTAAKGDVEQFVSLKGTVVSSEQEVLFAPAQVTVHALHVEKGDIVQAEDLLAEFDVVDLKNSYNQASLQYANAKLSYEDALRSNEENNEKALFYQRRLRDTQDEIDSLNEISDAAEIAELKGDIAEFKAERKAALNSVMSDEKLAQLKNSMNLAGISVNSSKKYLDEGKAGIMAGISGVITELNLSEGGMTSGTASVVIQSLENPEISLSLGKYDLGRIKTGQSVIITIGDAEYPGHISHIDAVTSVEGTNTVVKAKVAFDMVPENVVLGIETDLSILVASRHNVVVLPFEVIRTDREGDYCFVIENGLSKKVYIELGIGSDTHSEVLSGLAKGAVVVYTAPTSLTEGMPVTIDSQD